MPQINHRIQFVSACLLSAIALGLPGIVQPASAQLPEIEQSSPDTSMVFNAPKPPNQGSPRGRKRGGASRGNCKQFESLSALVPDTNGLIWGQTVSDRPTFWFYLPSPLTTDIPIEFMLQDAAGNDIYSTRLTTSSAQAGLIQLSLPATAKPLQVGQSYLWAFSVDCSPGNPPVAVTGSIQRVALTTALQRQLQGKSSLLHAKVYAANGIWFDALNAIATVYRTNPKQRQVADSWTSLLRQVNLMPLATAPFADCCTPAPETPNRLK